MNTDQILQQLRDERDRLSKAIDALEGQPSSSRTASVGKKRRTGISAAGRRRLSEMMKARWAARRAQTAGKSTKKVSPKKK